MLLFWGHESLHMEARTMYAQLQFLIVGYWVLYIHLNIHLQQSCHLHSFSSHSKLNRTDPSWCKLSQLHERHWGQCKFTPAENGSEYLAIWRICHRRLTLVISQKADEDQGCRQAPGRTLRSCVRASQSEIWLLILPQSGTPGKNILTVNVISLNSLSLSE